MLVRFLHRFLVLNVYRIVKNFGSKKGWRIRTVESLAEKTLANNLHWEFYGNIEN